LLIMAGIWERWQDPNSDQTIHSFAIITGAPNAEMKPLHDRMPMLLQSELQQTIWLDGNSSLDEVLDLLHTPLDGTLTAYQVGSGVGNFRNNGPGLHVPINSN
ncbi:MAG: SOS response-associated peptidase family protein, partial [Bacteroidota bacterium]